MNKIIPALVIVLVLSSFVVLGVSYSGQTITVTVEPETSGDIPVGEEAVLVVKIDPAGMNVKSGTLVFRAGNANFQLVDDASLISSSTIFLPSLSVNQIGSGDWYMSGTATATVTLSTDSSQRVMGKLRVRGLAAGPLELTLLPEPTSYFYQSSFVKHAVGALTQQPITITGAGAVAVCGDGTVTSPEACDEGAAGNLDDGTGCSSTCAIEAAAPLCGNGVLDGGEKCDGTSFSGVFLTAELTCDPAIYSGGTVTCDNTCQGLSYAGCVPRSTTGICTGTPPANAHACLINNPPESMNYVLYTECSSDLTTKCQYVCDDGFYRAGSGGNYYCQSGSAPLCADGVDNDGDDLVDDEDPGCHSDGDATNDGSYVSQDNSEVDSETVPVACTDDSQCSSGLNCLNNECTDVLQKIRTKLEDSTLTLIQRISAIAQILRTYLASS